MAASPMERILPYVLFACLYWALGILSARGGRLLTSALYMVTGLAIFVTPMMPSDGLQICCMFLFIIGTVMIKFLNARG